MSPLSAFVMVILSTSSVALRSGRSADEVVVELPFVASSFEKSLLAVCS